MTNSDPTEVDFASRLLQAAASDETLGKFCGATLALLDQNYDVRNSVLIRSESGTWRAVSQRGSSKMPPHAMLADAADTGEPEVGESWTVLPLRLRSHRNWLLAIQVPMDNRLQSRLPLLSTLIAKSLDMVLQRLALAKRNRRVEASMAIAAQWHANSDPEALLSEIAHTSTQLFAAERASIFLWDRAHNQLVGKPALGVNDELTIPDDAGVVGNVVQTGNPMRADETQNADQISRDTDAALGFTTESLLCVPIVDRRGKILGAFELLNHRDGRFDHDDEEGLVELASHAAVAIENSQAHRDLMLTKTRLEQQSSTALELIGNSAAMSALRERIAKVAPTDLITLVLGENGTGKEIVSRLIHRQSPRADKSFLAVNCAAITETLIESELFGHERGAFTDAKQSKIGKFEAADGGTLFLDEVGELSQKAQAKLLRALEQKSFTRVGGTETIHTDTRVIAATNRDLATMVQTGSFREDLFFRLNVVTINVPPLRDRPDDIVPLAEHFLGSIARTTNRPVPQITPDAKSRLETYHWPGNVRELRNLAERLAYLCTDNTIAVSDLRALAPLDGEPGLSLSDATRQFQTQYIERQIASVGGNMTEAAKSLGLHRSNLYRKMRQLGMSVEEASNDND